MSSIDVVLQVEHLSKSFGNTQALDDVQLEVHRNEIVTIVGQNGAGKSTLTKILVGAEHPDSGKIIYNGENFSPSNPLEAARMGISMVYQEGSAVPDLRVFQWMFLGHEIGSGFHLSFDKMRKKTDVVFRELGIDCSSNDRMRDITPVMRKMVEIARAFELMDESKSSAPIIILDEPTASLTAKEKETLYSKISEISKRASFIFISHIISEVIRVADRIVVLRDGRNAGAYHPKGQRVTEDMIFEAMTGKVYQRSIQREPEKVTEPTVALSVNNITRRGLFYDVKFVLAKGEILALMGLPNSGKSEIAKAVAGIVTTDSGEIEKNGKKLGRSIASRIRSGIAYLSGQRTDEIYQMWPVMKNITIADLDRLRGRWMMLLPVIDGSKEYGCAKAMVDKLGIRGQVDTLVGNLSGGNMQKVALGKLLVTEPDILVLDNVTVGIDVGTKEDFYGMLLRMKAEGKSFILISDDPDEINRLADRRLEVEEGRIREG